MKNEIHLFECFPNMLLFNFYDKTGDTKVGDYPISGEGPIQESFINPSSQGGGSGCFEGMEHGLPINWRKGIIYICI